MAPIGISVPRKKPPFIPKEREETFRTSVGPIFRAGDPPTVKVTYYDPLHTMGPNLYPPCQGSRWIQSNMNIFLIEAVAGYELDLGAAWRPRG